MVIPSDLAVRNINVGGKTILDPSTGELNASMFTKMNNHGFFIEPTKGLFVYISKAGDKIKFGGYTIEGSLLTYYVLGDKSVPAEALVKDYYGIWFIDKVLTTAAGDITFRDTMGDTWVTGEAHSGSGSISTTALSKLTCSFDPLDKNKLIVTNEGALQWTGKNTDDVAAANFPALAHTFERVADDSYTIIAAPLSYKLDF